MYFLIQNIHINMKILLFENKRKSDISLVVNWGKCVQLGHNKAAQVLSAMQKLRCRP